MGIKIRPAVAVVILTALGGACDAPGGDTMPAAEISPSVEGIAASVVAELPTGVTADQFEEGRRLYATCAVCHGDDADGTQLGPSLRGSDWVHVNPETEGLESIIRTGVARPANYPVPMPPMGGGSFDDQQLRSLTVYLEALGRSDP